VNGIWDADDDDLWHPSGWTPVYDRFLSPECLAGFSSLRAGVALFRMTRPDTSSSFGAFYLTGAARRILRGPFFCWVVEDGSPHEMPDFWPI
jgi:hypothetical protein